MKKCIYLTEGECEEKLVKALKEKPSLIAPGKVWKFNVIQMHFSYELLKNDCVFRTKKDVPHVV